MTAGIKDKVVILGMGCNILPTQSQQMHFRARCVWERPLDRSVQIQVVAMDCLGNHSSRSSAKSRPADTARRNALSACARDDIGR